MVYKHNEIHASKFAPFEYFELTYFEDESELAGGSFPQKDGGFPIKFTSDELDLNKLNK